MKIKTRGRLLLLIIIAILVFSISINVIIYFQFNNYITNYALKSCSKLTLQLISQEYPGDWKEENGKLYKGDKLINYDNEIVDMIKRNTNSECTIFLKDTRVTTTIVKNNKRVVGTKARSIVIKKVLIEGDEYIGPVRILGSSFQTVYLPIKSQNGKTIGMFFIGVQQKMINKSIRTVIFPIILTTIILLLIITIFIVLLTMKLVLDPLTALKMQDEIFANISHELKTPVNVIYSTNQLIEYYFKNDLLENKRQNILNGIYIVRQNCYRLTRLINNIVDLSKMDSGFVKLNLSNQNIVQVVEDIVQSVTQHINGKGISIIFDTDTEEKIVACDVDKIERVILNLISNAVKFTNYDGQIFINIFDKGDNVEIAIEDTGIGIDTKNLDIIFKRFHQVDKSLSRNAEGSGIGLSLVKSIVELHNGKISVDSKIGEGTIFKINIPVRIINEDRDIKDINICNNKIEKVHIEFSDVY